MEFVLRREEDLEGLFKTLEWSYEKFPVSSIEDELIDSASVFCGAIEYEEGSEWDWVEDAISVWFNRR